jgi:hypothetical protein
MAFGVPHSDHAVRHSRTTRWRLHLLARIAFIARVQKFSTARAFGFGDSRRYQSPSAPGVIPEERNREQQHHHYMRDNMLAG